MSKPLFMLRCALGDLDSVDDRRSESILATGYPFLRWERQVSRAIYVSLPRL